MLSTNWLRHDSLRVCSNVNPNELVMTLVDVREALTLKDYSSPLLE